MVSKRRLNSDGSCKILTSREVLNENKPIGIAPNHPYSESETNPDIIGLSVYRCGVTAGHLEVFYRNMFGVGVTGVQGYLVETPEEDWGPEFQGATGV